MPSVTVFGAVALDCRLTARRPIVPATSNPTAAREAPGGVGRNVAAALAALGAQVRLASRLGSDPAGDWLLAALGESGIDTSFIERSATAATARYWAILEPSGELALGLSDMAVLDEITPDELDAAAAAPADAWLIDLNLPEPAVARLLAHPRRPPLLAVDTVSVSKAEKIRSRLGSVDLLLTNAAEAAELVGAADAGRLLASGAGAVVMGRGAAGLDVAGETGIDHLPALATAPTVHDVTGAGDTLGAGTLFGLLHGLDLVPAARLGRLAAFALITESAFPALQHLHRLAAVADKTLHAELARLLARGG